MVQSESYQKAKGNCYYLDTSCDSCTRCTNACNIIFTIISTSDRCPISLSLRALSFFTRSQSSKDAYVALESNCRRANVRISVRYAVLELLLSINETLESLKGPAIKAERLK